jgi:hypothetical protein
VMRALVAVFGAVPRVASSSGRYSVQSVAPSSSSRVRLSWVWLAADGKAVKNDHA